jgi:hypothetical protein
MINKNHSSTSICFLSFLLLSFFAFFPILTTFGQESNIWMKNFGGINDENCFSALTTPDGGYILVGETASFGAGETDVWLIKTDSNGNSLWNKTYGGELSEHAQYMIKVHDGYIIAARTYSFGEGDADLWLIKTDNNGNIMWNHTYGGTGTDWMWSIVETSDGGYSMAGRTNSFGAGNNDFWLIKTNSEGLLEWNKTIGTTGDDRARFLVKTQNEGFLILGWTNSSGVGEVDYWVVKTDSSGNAEWNRTYGGELGDRGITMVRTNDNAYLLAGSSSSFGSGNSDIWLVKIDGYGNHIWNRTYGGSEGESVRSILMTDDGGFAFAGYTSSFGSGDQDGWFVKIDDQGNLMWNQTFGGLANDLINSLQKSQQDGYLLAGFSSSNASVDTDIMLIKTDAYGIIPEFPSNQLILISLALTWGAILYFKKKSKINFNPKSNKITYLCIINANRLE